MEFRFNERFAANTDVSLYQHGFLIAQGKIKNRSRFGFFIESTFTDIRAYQLVDVHLFLSTNSIKSTFYKFNSIVMHTKDDGFGVEFDSIEDNYGDAVIYSNTQ